MFKVNNKDTNNINHVDLVPLLCLFDKGHPVQQKIKLVNTS